MPLYNQITSDIKNGKILTTDGNKFSVHTAYNYQTGAFRFRLWEKEKGKIYLEDINVKWAEQFTLFLMSKGYAKNSIAVTLARLKAVLRRLYDAGIGSYNGHGIKAGNEQVTTVYSRIEDLQLLLDADFSETPGLERVRDVYVMQCFLGLRYSDLKKLLNDPKQYLRTIGGKLFFEIKTKKTGEVVVIPISRVARQMLDKYQYDFGKAFTYQYYNLAIKDVAAKAGIAEEVIFTRTEGGIRVDTPRLKWALMSSHTARRTFATNAFLSGMPEKNIMLITGHKTTQAFQRYIRCSNLDAAIKIANHDFFNIDLPVTIAITNNQIALEDENSR